MRAGFPAILLGALPLLTSCAAVPASPTAASQATAAGAATILAIRPIVSLGGDGAGWRAALLSGATDPTGAAPPASAAEFIIREDAGATLSIVQSNASGLHPGDRVVITHGGGRPGLTRLL